MAQPCLQAITQNTNGDPGWKGAALTEEFQVDISASAQISDSTRVVRCSCTALLLLAGQRFPGMRQRVSAKVAAMASAAPRINGMATRTQPLRPSSTPSTWGLQLHTNEPHCV